MKLANDSSGIETFRSRDPSRGSIDSFICECPSDRDDSLRFIRWRRGVEAITPDER